MSTFQPDGTLDGNLYIKGHGDPTFVVEDLWKMMRDLQLAGHREHQGQRDLRRLVSLGEHATPGLGQEAGPRTRSYLLLDALGVVAQHEYGRDDDGARWRRWAHPVSIQLETPTAGYVRGRQRARDGAVAVAAPDLPSSARCSPTRRSSRSRGASPSIVGGYPIAAPSGDPTAHFASAFEYMMKDVGIKVRGRYQRGDTPA